MGEFLTEFLEALRRRLPDLRGAFLQTDRSSGDLVGRWFSERWLPELPAEVVPERVVAIDASMDTRQYAGGVTVIYARALAMEFRPLDRSRGERVAARTFDVVPHTGQYDEARNLSSRLAEHLEHMAAIQAMETLEPGVLLLDGSLAGRHIASVFNFTRHGWFAAEYALAYSRMLELARLRGWRVLAVAKTSRAAPMRDLALREIFSDLMSRLSTLDPATESELVRAWDLAAKDPMVGVEVALNAAEDRPDLAADLTALAHLFYEKHLRHSDVDVIRRYVRGEGRTPAMLVGPYTDPVRKQVNSMRDHPLDFAREASSPETARRALEGERGEDLEETALRAVREAISLPTPVTVYARFREGDDPMKLEFSCWELGVDLPWHAAPPERLVEQGREAVGRLVGVARAGYAGPRFHNVWLERVDRRVKLRAGTVEALYERYLWRELGELVPHSRGERRVFGI